MLDLTTQTPLSSLVMNRTSHSPHVSLSLKLKTRDGPARTQSSDAIRAGLWEILSLKPWHQRKWIHLKTWLTCSMTPKSIKHRSDWVAARHYLFRITSQWLKMCHLATNPSGKCSTTIKARWEQMRSQATDNSKLSPWSLIFTVWEMSSDIRHTISCSRAVREMESKIIRSLWRAWTQVSHTWLRDSLSPSCARKLSKERSFLGWKSI